MDARAEGEVAGVRAGKVEANGLREVGGIAVGGPEQGQHRGNRAFADGRGLVRGAAHPFTGLS